MLKVDFSEKVFDPKKKVKLLNTVYQLTLDGFKPQEIADLIGKQTEVAIYGYHNELVEQGRLEKSSINNRLKIYDAIDGTGEYITLNRKAFSRIPIIKQYMQKKYQTHKDSQTSLTNVHITRLCTFCNTCKFNPTEVLFVKDIIDFLSEKMLIFRNALNSGTVNYLRPNNTRIKKNSNDVSHQPYSRAWASLLDAIGKPLPQLSANHILNRSRTVRGAYSNVALTYNQFIQGLEFIKANFEKEYLACYLLMVEIFPRTNALFTNPINIKMKYTEVDGKQFGYGVIENWYEEKQTEFYTKLIIDPEILRLVQGIITNGEPIFKSNIHEHKRKFNDIMRRFYISMNLLPDGVIRPLNDPERPIFKKYTNQYYIDLDPTYTLRHTGAIFACNRCGFEVSKVAKLGWKSAQTLEENYANLNIDSLVSDKKCMYCNPPSFDTEYLEFCRFAHAIAWFNNGKNPKAGLTNDKI